MEHRVQVRCQMTVKAVNSNDLTPFHQSLEYQILFLQKEGGTFPEVLKIFKVYRR